MLLPPLSCCPAVALARDSGLLSPALIVALCIALGESPQLSLRVGSEAVLQLAVNAVLKAGSECCAESR